MFNRLRSLILDKNIATAGASKNPPEGYFLPLSAADLLSLPHRKKMLRQIWDNSSLPENVYSKLYLAPLKDLASAVQNVPAASQGEWSREGGYIDLTLQYCAYSVRLAKGYMFPPGTSPEEQSAQNSLWNAVIFWSALFSHLPLLNRYSGELLDGRQWLPGVTAPDSPYRFKVVGNKVIDNGIATAGLMASRLLPQEGYAWLAVNPEAWCVLASFIYHDSTAMPAINEILLKASELVNSPQKTSSNPADPCSVMQSAGNVAIPAASTDTPKEELSSLSNTSTAQDTAAIKDEISGLVSASSQNRDPYNKTEASESGSANQPNNDTDVLLGLLNAVDPSLSEDNETVSDFTRSLLLSEPSVTVTHWITFAYQWAFVDSGFVGWVQSMYESEMNSGNEISRQLKSASGWLASYLQQYLLASVWVAVVTLIRVTILTLSIPLFVLVIAVAVVEGLGRRDLRRYGAGYESSFLYHRAKRLIKPAVYIPAMAYLSWPSAVYPNLLLLPAAIMLGLAITVTTASFKKYL